MRKISASILLVLFTVSTCLADFKYTEKSKVTGGSMMGAMKAVGVFSKDARQVTQGMNSTITLKGNKMRRDDDLGNSEIYDLDARRIVHIDSRHKTYSIMTFDEMRAQIEEANRKAAEQQAKSKDKNAQVKITPKVQITPGKDTKQLLGHTAKETKLRVDMEIQSQDPKQQGQTANFWVASDSWLAPVKGSDEVKRFYTRMAKELNWLPGAVMGGGNTQIAPAMVEYRKDVSNLNGFPLLQYVSVGGAGTGQPQQAEKQSGSSSPGGAIAKGIGGLFGKKKKKEDETAQQDTSSDSKTAAANSLMDMTIEVTSVSTDAVDAGVFDVPQGYKQVEQKSGRH
jgi:hypothetical protein